MRIGIDMGHTLSGAGTSANGYVRESDKNREAGKRLIAMLQEKGHTVVNCTVDYSSNDLYDRTVKANAQDLDLFISLHLNAFKMLTQEMGVETYIYSGSYPGKEANRATAQRVQNELVKNIGWIDRKVKEDNFYVLRETKAPAILIELGFCDSKGDMDKWNTEKIAASIFKGVTGTDYVGTSKPSTGGTSGVFYRVVTGSYLDRSKAEEQQARLSKAGYKSFLDAYSKDGKTYLRVIAGSFEERANADKALKEIKAKGFDAFIAVYEKGGKPSTPAPAPTPVKPKKNYLFLKAHVTKWNVYRTNVAPVVGNQCGALAPSQFGGLEYEILGNPQADVYTIQTESYGRVNIYVPKDGDSSFYSK